MSLIDRLFGRAAISAPPAPVAQTMLAEPARPFVNTHALGAAGLRINMWAVLDGQLAIVTGARLDGLVEVTLQKSDGTTRMELDAADKAVPAVRVVEPSALRHARIEEIPSSRHPDVDHEAHLRSFGYISHSEVAQ